METNLRNEDEIEIDMVGLLHYLAGKTGYIIVTVLAFAVLALAVTTFCMTPLYTSTTKMYVLNRQTNEGVTSSDLQSSTYLTKDYMELIKSRTVIETVIADLNLDSTYEEVLGQINVSAASDTRVIAISVTDKDPYKARDIANAVRSAAAAHIQSVMNTEAVTVVDEANIPTKKSSPSTMKNVVIAGGSGLILALAVCVVLFLMNDKVTTVEDVERYLGLSVLASMPLEEEEVRKKKARKKLEKKKLKKKKRRAAARR